ncbi:hypothetical protein CC80DRAFT_511555 [Byssothecium circinans]|uniref:Uncharacterized protein n=1 Tax=Byssothecium circinans TaxID=147558 RepID=A0A6A5TH10_9PLEO|nr:hypothetical protein CC80DRAFT_511555 [Byssothecium circinans]
MLVGLLPATLPCASRSSLYARDIADAYGKMGTVASQEGRVLSTARHRRRVGKAGVRMSRGMHAALDCVVIRSAASLSTFIADLPWRSPSPASAKLSTPESRSPHPHAQINHKKACWGYFGYGEHHATAPEPVSSVVVVSQSRTHSVPHTTTPPHSLEAAKAFESFVVVVRPPQLPPATATTASTPSPQYPGAIRDAHTQAQALRRCNSTLSSRPTSLALRATKLLIAYQASQHGTRRGCDERQHHSRHRAVTRGNTNGAFAVLLPTPVSAQCASPKSTWAIDMVFSLPDLEKYQHHVRMAASSVRWPHGIRYLIALRRTISPRHDRLRLNSGEPSVQGKGHATLPACISTSYKRALHKLPRPRGWSESGSSAISFGIFRMTRMKAMLAPTALAAAGSRPGKYHVSSVDLSLNINSFVIIRLFQFRDFRLFISSQLLSPHPMFKVIPKSYLLSTLPSNLTFVTLRQLLAV